MASVYINLPLVSVDVSAVATQATLLDILAQVEPLTPSFQEITNLTTTAQTFVAPAGAKWMKISAGAQNTTNLRFKLSGTATANSGTRLEASRTEDLMVAGDVSVIAESGSGLYVCVTFGA